MRCNQRFFGQEHFERGTAEREFCSELGVLKPVMTQYGHALRDVLPQLPSDEEGLVQVKYNGMLSIVKWNEERDGFVAWNPRGRCYYSLGNTRKHPVTEHFNQYLSQFRDISFIGETYVARKVSGRNYMTEFNKSMSIIKNPRSTMDVSRIKLAVFDYAKNKGDGRFERSMAGYLDRFKSLQYDFKFPVGCDSDVVHLPDYLETEGNLQDSYAKIQAFWNEFIGKRRFEGLVMHTNGGKTYKIKFRDTLDAAIIAFRKAGDGRPMCKECGTRFDAFWLRKLSKDGVVARSDWFDQDGRLLNGKNDVWNENLDSCPICGGSVSNTSGPILGAKIALMTPDGNFLDIADGVQFSPLSPILDLVEPLYEGEGYLWVKPEIVVEVSYQQLYLDRPRPIYCYEKDHYARIGTKKAISLRPYKPRLREDKTVTPRDLRLEQVSYFVDKIKRIKEKWRETTQKGLSEYV